MSNRWRMRWRRTPLRMLTVIYIFACWLLRYELLLLLLLLSLASTMMCVYGCVRVCKRVLNYAAPQCHLRRRCRRHHLFIHPQKNDPCLYIHIYNLQYEYRVYMNIAKWMGGTERSHGAHKKRRQQQKSITTTQWLSWRRGNNKDDDWHIAKPITITVAIHKTHLAHRVASSRDRFIAGKWKKEQTVS